MESVDEQDKHVFISNAKEELLVLAQAGQW